jgi:tetratricopeptide (TPR) repeat protein
VAAQPHWLEWVLTGLLGLATLAVYWPATGFEFINFDDPEYVTENLQVQNGLSWTGMKWAGTNPVLANWHPLTVLSHMLACQIFRLEPWGHHLINILLHAVNGMLVFALLHRMTGARWRSLLVAALFALHPLRVESVAWVSERKDVLSGFFGLLALLAYVRYAQKRSQKAEGRAQKPTKPGTQPVTAATLQVWHFMSPARVFCLLSLVFFLLGLMSKPALVTWPFIMLLLDYWPLRRFEPASVQSQLSRSLRLVGEKIPFFVLAALASVVTFVAQRHAGSLMTVEYLPLSARVGNGLISYWRHLGRLFGPADLAVFYPHPGHWPLEEELLAGGLILGLTSLVWLWRRPHPYLLAGWLWFLGMLLPMIGLVQTGGQALADRHTYLPSLGALILVLWGVCELTRGWRYQAPALAGAGSAAIVVCLALTSRQLRYWKDSETLSRRTLEVTEHNYVAHISLGDALGKKGRLDEAIRQYQAALRLTPGYALPHLSLGMLLVKQGRMGEAIRQFQEGVRLEPDNPQARNNLGHCLMSEGETEQAVAQFQEAVRLKPDYALAYNNLGLAFRLKGQTDEAIRQFQEALRLKPDYADARRNLDAMLTARARSSPLPGTATNR